MLYSHIHLVCFPRLGKHQLRRPLLIYQTSEKSALNLQRTEDSSSAAAEAYLEFLCSTIGFQTSKKQFHIPTLTSAVSIHFSCCLSLLWFSSFSSSLELWHPVLVYSSWLSSMIFFFRFRVFLC